MNPLVRCLLFLSLLLTAACNVTKHLPPGETLYAGPKITVDGESKKTSKELKGDLKTMIRPQPNTNILGWRYKIWFYYVAGEPKGKGIRNWIRKTLGEPPVLASSVNVEKNRVVLENRLQNKGYFHAAVDGDTVTKNRFTTVRYHAVPGARYKIRSVHYPEDSSDISKEMNASAKRSLIVPGEPYDLETIKNERLRIDTRLKNKGYYFFNADYIIDIVDTTVGSNQVDMFLKLKPTTPTADIKIYRINNIWVYPTYTIQDDSMLGEAPAIPVDDYFVIDPEGKFKPTTFKGMLLFHKGQPYSRRSHNQSLNRLVSMGNFRFVKAKFEEVDTAGNYLDPYFFMTPLPQRSAKLEVSGLTKTNNAAGTEVSVNWTNRNLFRGAEQLTTGIFGGFESQATDGESISISRLGVEGKLTFPRVIAPFRLNTSSDFVPKTRISARYEFYERTKQYTLNSSSASYGFIWKTDIRIEHQLNILNLNFVQPINIDPQFQKAIDTDITLARTIEPQFILGPSYNFNYNSNARANRRIHNFYFNGNIEVPGNILGVISGTEFNQEKQGKGTIFGTPFSQYLRVETDFRYYLNLGDKHHPASIWASRFLAGVGLPYGNSLQMPFIKAFFAGGVSDIRAFRARSLGPGSYNVRDHYSTGVPPDQPGDIKLLASTELRAKLISILHGAVFVDAGNVWTIKNDTARPGAQFTSNFLNQTAVGAGVGLRLDLSFLVVRFDLAIPIVKPYAVVGKEFDFGNSDWRKENLILNFGLGYPF